MHLRRQNRAVSAKALVLTVLTLCNMHGISLGQEETQTNTGDAQQALDSAKQSPESDKLATKAEPSAPPVTFQRHQFNVERVRGKVYVAGAPMEKNAVENQSYYVRLIEHFDRRKFETTGKFKAWARKLRGVRTYTFDTVHRTLPDGSQDIRPLVFLPKMQRAAVQPAWLRWLDEQMAAAKRSRAEADRLRQEERRYQAIENLTKELTSSASQLAQASATPAPQERWEVFLSKQESILQHSLSLTAGPVTTPPINTGANRISVVVAADNSYDASRSALARYPAYQFAGARRVY
ncbi:MAG: hypothetical protein Aurels2KO_41270 [Aureliella sp.]